MPKRQVRAVFCAFALLLGFGAQALYAEFFSDEAGSFAFDLPDGFVLTGASDTSYSLQSTLVPVEVIVRVYPQGVMESTAAALQAVFGRLNAQGSVSEFIWRDQLCALTEFSMQPQGYTAPQSGWALASPLPETGGVIVVLAYAQAQIAPGLQQFLLSTLDSLYIDDESWLSPGPITAFAFPENGQKTLALRIADIPISTTIGVEDSEASSFVIEREFSVLTMYIDSELVMSAWQRYYRQIYRDAYGRLKTAAGDITAALTAKNTGKVPREEYLLRTLLAWTQQFSYARDFSASDFSPLPSLLEGGGSDCDSRSMLLSVILNNAGYNTLMFFSPSYKHALLGMDIHMSGAKIDVEGTEYLLGETTAPVAPGLVAEEMQDTEQWIPVIFPQ
jgi:hypothetical protein